MDIFCTVEGQKLRIDTPIKHFPRSSENFVRFLFTMSDEWNGLTTFAQFRQYGQYSNTYLYNVIIDDVGYKAVTLPGWPKPGPLSMLLYGTGNETVIGTTNHVLMHVDATGLIDADVSDMDETLYQQLINRITWIEANARSISNVYSSMTALKADSHIEEGRVVQTVSFYDADEYEDGKPLGGAEYDIVRLEGNNVPTWWIPLDNGLYARIRNAKVYPEMLGAYRDNKTDDSDAIQMALDTGRPVGLSLGTYAVQPRQTKTRTFYWKEQDWSDPQYPYTVSFAYGFSVPPGGIIEGDRAGATNSTNGSVLRNIGDGYVAWMRGDYRRPARMERFSIAGNGYNDGIIAMLNTDTPNPASKSGCWGGTPVIREFTIRNCRTPICGYSVYLADISQGTIFNSGAIVMTYGQYAGNLPDGVTRAPQYTTNNFTNCNTFRNIFFINQIKTASWTAAPGNYYTVDGEAVASDDPAAFWKDGYYLLTPPKETTYVNADGDALYINEPCVRIDHGSNFIFDNCSFQYNRLGVSCDYVKGLYFKNCHFEGVDFCYYTRVNRSARFYGGSYTWLIAYRDRSTAADRAAADAVAIPAWVKRLYRYKKSFVSHLTDYGKAQVNLYRSALNTQLQNAGNLSAVASLTTGSVLLRDIYADAAAYGDAGTAAENAVDLSRRVHPSGDLLALSTGTPDTFYYARIGAGETMFNVPLNTKYAAAFNTYFCKYDFTSLVNHSEGQGALFDVYVIAYTNATSPSKVFCARYTMYKWRGLYFISEPQIMRNDDNGVVGKYDVAADDYFYLYTTKPASHRGRLYFVCGKLVAYTSVGNVTAAAAVTDSAEVALTEKIDETNMDDYPFVYGVVKTAATASNTIAIYAGAAAQTARLCNVNINGTMAAVTSIISSAEPGEEENWEITLSKAVTAEAGDLILLDGNVMRTVSGRREIVGATTANNATVLTLNSAISMEADEPMVFGDDVIKLVQRGGAYKAVVKNEMTTLSMTISYRYDPCPGDLTPRYQVRFVASETEKDQDILPSQSRAAGAKLLKNAIPVRDGYTFTTWCYKDRSGSTTGMVREWDMDATTVAATQAEPDDPYTIILWAG